MRHYSRVRAALALGAVVALLVVGCTKSAPATTTAATTTTTKVATTAAATTTAATTASKTTTAAATTAAPKSFGELKVAFSSLYDEKFDPVPASPSNAFTIVAPYMESLLDMDGPKLAPMIAESWQMAPDWKSWVYKIRKGIKFQNGDNLTAADVKFSIDRFISKESYNRDLANAVESTEQVDDYTVRLVTKGAQPFLPYLTGLAGPYDGMIMPKAYFEKVGKDGFNAKPVGSGPFKFAGYSPGDSVKYESVDQHWRIVPEFKNLTLMKIPEESTRIAMLKSGQADVIEVAVENVPLLESAGMKTVNLTTAMAGVLLYGNYDPRAAGKPTADIRVRRALSLAINRAEVNKTLFFGKATPPAPPYVWEGTADADYNEAASYASKVYAYDINEAKRLLTEAGYPTGFKLNLYAYTMGDAPYLPKLAEVVQGYWLKIGVTASMVPTEWTKFRLQARPAANAPPSDEVIGQAATHSASNKWILTQGLPGAFQKGGSLQLVYPGIPELETLIPQATVEMDPAKRREMIKKIMTLSAESYTFLPFGGVPYMAAVGPRASIKFNEPSTGIGFYLERAKHTGK
ncbi:MAG: ABC transporter substrate-binding protein [Chloroflexi bacterium]|nr:ABC transporter substrate-binding protein [Chloroflexota bacterium]